MNGGKAQLFGTACCWFDKMSLLLSRHCKEPILPADALTLYVAHLCVSVCVTSSKTSSSSLILGYA